ncbi:NAD-dependent dihydropyrimidine dehydrogenase subunit PreA [Clostridium pasteurianum]|uniref:Dihydroorotate dehydrogenase B (NAD(+)), catalytic subunit n=1 Tax=Clostridium pasteurianum BC1 TaxID=86416 RepID=R4K0I3_CLOPA|nr:NAD-dependent dihydropyrimidine dehydrogenase subunit PreA [Clostridium pasteurianum]AGK96063.1 dihydroorotate dehydrogenase family protein [Clostridium pasteurianum BC1]
MRDLSIEFCGVKCENPFFLSSSVVGNNFEMCAKALEMGWGGVVFKTIGFYVAKEVSPRFDTIGKEGTPFIGFKNLEQISEHSLEENLEWMRQIKEKYPNKILVASIMGQDEEEWTELAKLVTETGADIIECNFSCPQMADNNMGCDVGQNPELVKKYCEATRRGTNLPILAKMTPNIGNMEIPAIAAMEGGATGLAAINTIKSITKIDLDSFLSYPIVNGKSSVSGYSGKAVKPIALRFIHDLAKNETLKGVPISGMGGIETWEDAAEFILLGSTNIQITTAVMQYGYRIIEDLISGLSYYMEEKGFNKLQDMVGLALKNIVPAEELDRSFILYPSFDENICVGCGRCYISCYDGGHQAIKWDADNRKPILLSDKCVGCHLCAKVCPVMAISSENIKYKDIG